MKSPHYPTTFLLVATAALSCATAASAQSPATVGPETLTPQGAPSTLAFAPAAGTTRSFALSETIATQAEGARPDAAKVSSLSGQLTLRVLGAQDGLTAIAMRLSNVAFTQSGDDALAARALTAPFVAYVDETGAAKRLALAKLPFAYTEVLRRIAYRVFSPVQQTGDLSWTATVSDGRRTGQVTYAASGLSGASVRLTRKLDALAYVTATGRIDYRIEGSDGHIDVATDGSGIVGASWSESVIGQYRGRSVSVETTTFALDEVGASGAAMPVSVADAETWVSDDDTAARLHFYSVTPDMKKRLAGWTLDDVLGRFRLGVDGAPSRVVLDLRDYIRLHPDDSAAVIDFAERYPSTKGDRVRVGHLLSALGAAGHFEAQRALADAIEDPRLRAQTRDRAVMATMSMTRPEPFIPEAIWRYRQAIPASNDIALSQYRQIITNVYGMSGRKDLHVEDNTRIVVQTLEDALMQAQEPAAEGDVLLALGNTGDLERIYPVMAPYFDSHYTSHRRRAFNCFLQARSEDAFALFAEHYASETDADVRLSATSIAESMPPTTARNAWAQDRLLLEQDPIAQGRMVRILGDHLDAYPDNEATLERALDDVTDREVRHMLYRYVGPKGGAQ